jgi:hypothetical protein
LKVEVGCISSKKAYSANLKKHTNLSYKAIYVRNSSV